MSAFVAVLVVSAAGSSDVRGAGSVAPELQLPRDADVWISGPKLSRQAARFPWLSSVESVGDVNGDGTPDLAITNQQQHAGDETQTFVLFGGRLPKRVDLPATRQRGFAVRDATVQAAGDVNGDGRADLVRCSTPAEAKILVGRSGRQPAADQGFHVFGANCGQGVGDLNGDGLSDVLFPVNVSGQATSAAVVYGSRKPTAVHLNRLGRKGFRITGLTGTSPSIKPAGDLNGDGRADMLVLSAQGYSSTRLRVVFGRRLPGVLNLDTVSGRNLPVIACDAQNPISDFGAAGDVNGDGIGDVAVASARPAIFVVFGRRGTWPRVNSCGGTHGFETTATTKANQYFVGSAGDIDSDGLDDLLVSAPGEPGTTGAAQTGAVYLVFGRHSTTRVDLKQDARVVRIAMQPEGTVKEFHSEWIGWSAAAPGDVNHDGTPDIVVGGQTIGDSWIVSSALR